ncbi:MAG: galactitol-1-phosphate 5-dehydrogenase [Candidatus Hydrogenedentes bacterium]|nr:galactitol-1-phosphate 5-dehydrogenase [Candidatus Hydrogenedentota bacterium]
MKALVLTAYNTFAMEDVPVPAPKRDEVLVRVRACGICGSDVHGMDGSTGRRIPPIIMGHEASGVIAETGDKVVNWRTGDRVTFDSTIFCGTCAYCRQDRVNLCENRRVLGVSCAEYRQHGAFAEFVCVPARVLYSVPAEVPFEHAAMVEPVSVALHAVAHATSVPKDTAVVVGAGMIGLLIVQALRAQGYKQIVSVDVDDSRLALALQCGAKHILNADRVDVPSEVFKLTDGTGANAAFEAVGTSATVDAAIASACKGGAVVLVGNVSSEVQFPLQRVVTREISVFGSCASAGEYASALKLMALGHIDVRPLIGAVAPLEDAPDWFARLHTREVGLMKVVLTP